MPDATALPPTTARALDTTLSQGTMRFHGRTAIDAHYNGLALDNTEGERIARAMGSPEIAFLPNHGVVVCGERIDYAYDDLHYLERPCQAQVLALSTGLNLAPVAAGLAAAVARQVQGERDQSIWFFLARCDARYDEPRQMPLRRTWTINPSLQCCRSRNVRTRSMKLEISFFRPNVYGAGTPKVKSRAPSPER